MTPPTLRVAVLAAVAASGCAAETGTVLTVTGDAPGAVALFVRLVDVNGARKGVRSVGSAEHPVKLPATIHLQLARSMRVGAVVWIADAGGTIVATALTPRCFEIQPGNHQTVALSEAPEGWSPGSTDDCRCDPDELDAPMCAPEGPASGARDGGATAVIDATARDSSRDDEVGDAAPPAEDGAATDVGAAPADALPSADAPASDAPDARGDARDAAADLRAGDARPDVAIPVFVPNALFGFENAAPDWTSTETTLQRDTKAFTQGKASIAFTMPAAGLMHLRSRIFDTGDLMSERGTSISVDVFVAEAQPAEANTEMWVDCPSAAVNGVYVGYKALSALRVGSWTPLTFKMPGPVASALGAKLSDCKTWFLVEGTGLFRYDRMGFSP